MENHIKINKNHALHECCEIDNSNLFKVLMVKFKDFWLINYCNLLLQKAIQVYMVHNFILALN